MQPHLPKIKGYSHSWQTTLMVMLVMVVSVALSLWFFWRSLYLPELQNHANYLANQLLMLDKADKQFPNQPAVRDWIVDASHLQMVTNPAEFPTVEDKALIGVFTDSMHLEMAQVLGRPTTVYFKFKPIPMLYVQDSAHPDYWLREPIKYYSEYSTSTIVMFLVGIPFVALLTIWFLVRQLNRPLKRLQKVALDYITLGHASNLTTNEGSTEIRQVNLAFNRLFHNLSQTQKERNIMLAGISHDLRTPLTRMRLTAEMLPDEFLKDGLVYDIEDMDAILEQFISFMKDGSDEAVRLTDLNAIINEIVVQFAPLPFLVNVSADMPLIPLRPLSIKRMIVNLVNNANRYGQPPIHIDVELMVSQPTIETETEETDEVPELLSQQRYLSIRVSDEGEGVAEDQLERIMQPFERGETARTTQGSGLGLAIVSRIAHLHNGKVIAQNRPEGGLEVAVTMPIID